MLDREFFLFFFFKDDGVKLGISNRTGWGKLNRGLPRQRFSIVFRRKSCFRSIVDALIYYRWRRFSRANNSRRNFRGIFRMIFDWTLQFCCDFRAGDNAGYSEFPFFFSFFVTIVRFCTRLYQMVRSFERVKITLGLKIRKRKVKRIKEFFLVSGRKEKYRIITKL